MRIALFSSASTSISIDRIELCDTTSGRSAALIPETPFLIGPGDTLSLLVHWSRASKTADGSDVASEETPSVVIDEILADPPPGIRGDANQDGVRSTYQDEFVELFNAGPDTISIAGWRLGDDDTSREKWFCFPAGTYIPPKGRILLFGGGSPVGFDVPVFTDDGRIGNGLTNSGDTVILIDAQGDTIDIVKGSGWASDQSQVRFPSGSGAFTGHSSVPGCSAPFSPGSETLSDSTDPTGFLPPDSRVDPSVLEQARTSLIISEILADPPSGPEGDANRDGETDRYEDEFVEMFNAGAPLDLSGWRLGDDDTPLERQFRFPVGTVLASGEYLVLFGGGTPHGLTGLVFADDGRIGNGLTNSGDRILLLAGDPPDTVLDVSFTAPSNLDRSLVHSANGLYLPHDRLPGRTRFSPGAPRPEYTGFGIDSLEIVQGGPSVELPLFAYSPAGTTSISPALPRWWIEKKQIVRISSRGKVRGLRPGRTLVGAWFDGGFLAQGVVRVRPPPPPSNRPPRIVSTPDTTVYAGGPYRYQVKATDPENQTLIYTLARAPAWLHLHYASGLISGRAPPGSVGTTEVVFEVADGQGGLDAQCYRLHILPRPSLRITEILADPPSGLAGDANGDGRRQTYADEFVEFLNAGDAPIDLSGWRVSDGDVGIRSQFRFPRGAILPPGKRLVLFGRKKPAGEWSFSDDGRIGDGLGNRSDEVYLIEPEGPDTLVRIAYRLKESPHQSLVWSSHQASPSLHGEWPGRDPFSPGRPRPLLERIRMIPNRLWLISGRRARLRLIGQYSDGRNVPIDHEATWTSSLSRVAAVASSGVVTAGDTGRAVVSVRIDTFEAPDCPVSVRFPLARRLEFLPGWEQTSLPPGRCLLFSVRSGTPDRMSYRWSLNGRRQATTRSQFVHSFTGIAPDTIQVAVRSGREHVVRRWIVSSNLPPTVLELPDSLSVVGRLYSSRIQARDPEGDRLLYLLEAPPLGMKIDPASGNIRWRPLRSGHFTLLLRVSDGYHLVARSCEVHVLPPAAKALSASPFLRATSYPNPFDRVTTLEFHLPGEAPSWVEVRLYDAEGRIVRILLEKMLAPGRHAVIWDGSDEQRHPVASGLYLYRIRCKDQQVAGKLLLLR